jgi:urease accessory protein
MSSLSGHLRLEATARSSGRITLARQSFQAPFHLSKPYWDADAGTLLVQVVNPTAGILEGDLLESDITVRKDAALLVTTPSASRVFKMKNGSAAYRQQFAVAKGGWLEVLPEPLVPHRGCRYKQTTEIHVESGGGLFFVDLLMPGRIAHRDEAWMWERLCLETVVRWGGELILRERFEHSGAELKALAILAGSGPKACFGNAVLLGGEGALWLPAVAALHGEGVWLGVSELRRGGWSIKFVAGDSIKLRETLRRLRGILSGYYPRMACDPRKL